MNIGIDAKRIFFNNSGLGNYGRRYYRALAEAVSDDRFYLYSPRPADMDNPHRSIVIPENSQVLTPGALWNWSPARSVWRSWGLHANFKRDKIDIYYGLSNEIPLGGGRSKTLSVVVIHDLIFLRYPELYPASDVFFYKKKSRYACLNAHHIVAASEQTKQDIVNFYQVDPDKITVIYPATDPSFYSDEVADSDEFFKAQHDYFISVGAITPRKNLDKTVKAFGMIKDQTGLDLVVVGTATGLGKNYLASIRDYLQSQGLTGRVHFLGNVPYKYLPSLCRKAAFMVYPSQFEGFGMPIVEGLFSRIPVITSHGGCFPEAGGDGAYYVDPENVDELAAMMLSLSMPGAETKEMIAIGLSHAQKFTQARIREMILDLHQKVKAEL